MSVAVSLVPLSERRSDRSVRSGRGGAEPLASVLLRQPTQADVEAELGRARLEVAGKEALRSAAELHSLFAGLGLGSDAEGGQLSEAELARARSLLERARDLLGALQDEHRDVPRAAAEQPTAPEEAAGPTPAAGDGDRQPRRGGAAAGGGIDEDAEAEEADDGFAIPAAVLERARTFMLDGGDPAELEAEPAPAAASGAGDAAAGADAAEGGATAAEAAPAAAEDEDKEYIDRVAAVMAHARQVMLDLQTGRSRQAEAGEQ